MFRFEPSRLLRAVVTLAIVGLASASSASTATCSAQTAVTRAFALTLADAGLATCLGFGDGNINGNTGGGNADPIFTLAGAPSGLVLLDKSDNGSDGIFTSALSATGGSLVGGTSGSFSFSAPGYAQFVIGFKSGGGQVGSGKDKTAITPTWAAFLLPAGFTAGDWAIENPTNATGDQALSHVNLYGVVSTTVVPLPAAGWLLLAGLAGLATLRRRSV